jgi:DNA adenine methylase
MTAAPIRPPIGYFGSKTRVAPRLVDLMPAHRGYVEPYCGSLAVLLAKPRPSSFEVVNDLDEHLMTFWRVLREQEEQLERACALTPHSRSEYDAAWPIPDGLDDLERARRVWCKLAQGRSGSLRATGWRYHEAPSGRSSSMPRTMRGYVRRFAAVAERLANVTLECRPAFDVIERYGRDPSTLLYVDPPYLYDVRGGWGVYRLEAGKLDHHQALLELLSGCKAAVMLSGYPHRVYEQALAGWDRAELKAGTGQNTDAGWQERTEVVWCNRELSRQHAFDLEQAP